MFSGESFTNGSDILLWKCQVVPKVHGPDFLQFWGLPYEVSRGPDIVVSEITPVQGPIVNPSICKLSVRCPFQLARHSPE